MGLVVMGWRGRWPWSFTGLFDEELNMPWGTPGAGRSHRGNAVLAMTVHILEIHNQWLTSVHWVSWGSEGDETRSQSEVLHLSANESGHSWMKTDRLKSCGFFWNFLPFIGQKQQQQPGLGDLGQSWIWSVLYFSP